MGSSKSDEIRAKKYFLGEIGNSPLVNKLDIDNQQELDEAEAYFVENALANGLSEKAKELSPNGLKQMHKELFGELNTIHPFIDGNGRTQRKTLDLIAEKAGFSLNTSLLDKGK